MESADKENEAPDAACDRLHQQTDGGVPYSEPELTDEIVYSDEQFQIRKIWKWNVKALYEDKETGVLKVLIRGTAFNWSGKSTFATVDGKRLSETFDFIDSFHDGLARVAIRGIGFGFVDRQMNIAFPIKYDWAEDFQNGKAIARRGNHWSCVDKNGHELKLGGNVEQPNYKAVENFTEGMCRVSTLDLSTRHLAYFSDHDDIVGTWGFVDESGKEVIPPQYIYANDFDKNGVAIVAKGEWTISPKWDHQSCTGGYWRESELWGGIDKNGNEVIPFIFDEIKFFFDDEDVYSLGVYIAHAGGWKNGKWGVIDSSGKWLAEPVFEDIDYEYHDGLFAFYEKDKWSDPDNVPMGIYDIRQKKVILEPQFLGVNFNINGDICVEVFDRDLGRRIEKIIDRNGKERFKSIYSSICPRGEAYEVTIRDENGDRHEVIDKDGNIIPPCTHEIPRDEIIHERRMFIFSDNEKQGLKDYDGNVLIPAIYHRIDGWDDPLFTASVDGKAGLVSIDGKQIFPARYEEIRWCQDRKHFFCRTTEGCHEMFLFENK